MMWRVGVGLIFVVVVGAGAATLAGDAPSPKVSGADLGSPYRPYSLKLGAFVIPPAKTTGLLLKVRIDGGPTLRLLLDSGAQYIVLDQRAAARSGHSTGSDLDLIGLGSSSKPARMARASTVEIGDLKFRDCGLNIVEGKLVEGIDGVIPLSLFAGFLVRLGVPGKTLDLEPYPTGPAAGAHLTPAHASSDLLFLKVVLNDSREGYVLLDTGASYDAISERAARSLNGVLSFASPVPLQGGAGAAAGRLLSSQVRFRLGSRVLRSDQVVVVPLDQLERYHNIEVAGILGYPALRESVLTVNYRDGLVGIEGK